MCFGCSNLPFFQLLQREMEGGCKESWWGQTQDDNLQGEGGGWEMPGRCAPMFSLGSSQPILGGRGRREIRERAFRPLCQVPSPSCSSRWEGMGMLARHVPGPAPSTRPNLRHPPGTVPSQQSWGPRADLDRAGWGGWLHTRSHL